MHVRLLTLVVLSLVVTAVYSAPALAGTSGGVEVTVRVEGKAQTIFGSQEPLLTPAQGTLVAEGDTTVELALPTVLGALEAASLAGEFNYNLKLFSFGSFVDRIGRFGSQGLAGWSFRVNGKAPELGAGDVVLEDGDAVLWYWAKLDPVTFDGPDALRLIRRQGCLVAQAVDSNGKAGRASNVVFKLDSARRIRSKTGRMCATNWETAQVVKRGHIRSQVLAAG